jgi:hypothetical protein
MMPFQDLRGDKQAQAQSFEPHGGIIYQVITVKQLIQVLCGDPDAEILHGNDDPIFLQLAVNQYFMALWRILHRVG